jgi:Transposase
MRRYPDSERRRIVRDFNSSGLSAAAFCRRRGVSTVTLANWRRRFAHGDVAAEMTDQVSRPSWLPVVISGEGSSPFARDVVYRMLCGECRLEVPSGFAPGEVRQLWEMLASEHANSGSNRAS